MKKSMFIKKLFFNNENFRKKMHLKNSIQCTLYINVRTHVLLIMYSGKMDIKHKHNYRG